MDPKDRRLLRISAAAGAIAWCGLLTFEGATPLTIIERLLLLGPLVVVPLGLALVPDGVGSRRYRALVSVTARAQPIEAAAAAGSCLFEVGPAAGALAAIWLLVTLLVAAAGLLSFLNRGWAVLLRTLDALCLDAALSYLAVGGGWFLLARLGLRPLGFEPRIVLLTAVHFHFAAFAAPCLAALAARAAPPSPAAMRTMAAGVVAGPPVVAAGITAAPFLEPVGALLMSAGLAVLALGPGIRLLPTFAKTPARILFALSLAATIPAMVLAIGYAFGVALGRPFLSIPEMAWTHGILNGVLFSAGGPLAWTLKSLPEESQDVSAIQRPPD